MKHENLIKRGRILLFVTAVILIGGFFIANNALAAVTVPPASGGTNISADKAANATSPAYTTLGNMVITSGDPNDFKKNDGTVTFILTAPAGWEFNAGVGTGSVAGTAITFNSITVTTTTITVNYTRPKTDSSDASLTISGIQVRATNGASLPSSGNILRTSGNPGTATITGITNNVTNFGSLSQVAGAVSASHSTVSSSAASQTTDGGATVTITVTAKDQFDNNISGQSVVLSSTGSNYTFVQPAATNGSGQTTGTLASTKAETKTVSATAGGMAITQTASVTFQAGAIDHITITPGGPQSVNSGSTISFSAQGFDVHNNAISGLIYTWAVVPGTGTGSVNSSGVFTGINGGTATVTATNNGIIGNSGTITVNKLNQTITFGALAAKTYGDADFGVSAIASSGLGVTFSAADNCTISGTSVHITAAGSCTITAHQTGNSIYNAAPDVPQTFSIAKANAIIVVNDYNGVYNALAHGTTGTATGVNGEDLSGSLNLGSTFTDVPGSIAHWTFTGGANYNDASGDANVNITKATPTLSVTNSPVTYDGTEKAATVTGSVAGSVTNILTGGSATQTDADTYAVTADFAPEDSTNYNSLTGASAGNFIIIPVVTYTLTYTAGANGSITGNTSQTVNYGADGSEVTAVANADHHFTSWSDGILTATRTDTNVTGNVSVTANFVINTDKDIVSFVFPDLGSGVITGNNIAVEVPFGTNITALVPSIEITGVSVNPASGATQDFTNPVTYTVTAADASTQDYLVTVTLAADPDIASVASDRDALVNNLIRGTNAEDLASVTTDLTLVTSISEGGAGSVISWSSNSIAIAAATGVVTRPAFGSGNVTVTLTATITKGAVTGTKTFAVTVLETPNSAKAITAFSFPSETGVIKRN